MEIYLNIQQFDLLKKYCDLNINPIISPKRKNKISITGDKQFFENLLDKISDILTEKGMNKNSEPNELGLQIEEIIDLLSRVVYD